MHASLFACAQLHLSTFTQFRTHNLGNGASHSGLGLPLGNGVSHSGLGLPTREWCLP